jgi:hypothetical protein
MAFAHFLGLNPGWYDWSEDAALFIVLTAAVLLTIWWLWRWL